MAAPPPLVGGAPPSPAGGGGGGDAGSPSTLRGGGGGGSGGVPGPALLLPRPGVASLNAHLSCPVCKGYLVDATTLIKCLHSFCRSCILKHLDSGHHNCPVCDVRLSKINMEGLLMRDDTLQNVVYKAVPGLYQKEMKRRRDFYTSKGSKADQASLTPEQKGELDSSSSGRIIFSPDEAVSLSLEYKSATPLRTEQEASAAGSSTAQVVKEPAKRYLNCPAAVTISLLQKFLRMKYSISSRYKVDILYMDDVLWSKYTLMDVAYIYTWKRDMPLQLFYRVTENPPKPVAAVASAVAGGRTSAASDVQPIPPAQQGLGPAGSGGDAGITARSAATLGQSASVMQESRGSKEEEEAKAKETNELGTTKPPEREAAGESPEDKPSIDSASIVEAKVQSTTDAAPASAVVSGTTTTESGAAEQVPDISGAPNKACSLPTSSKRPPPKAKQDSEARTNSAPESRAVSVSLASKPITTAAPNCPDDQRASDKPALCIPVKVLPPGLPGDAEGVSGSGVETTLCGDVNIASATDDEATNVEDAAATVSVKASVRVEGGSSARTAGFVLRQLPSAKVTRPLNGLDKGISQALANRTTAEGSPVPEDETAKDGSDGDLCAAVPGDDKAPTKPLDFVLGIKKAVEDETPEKKNVQTCISRAAHKAEAKLNALKAAAALLKDTSQPEKDQKESGGLSVTLRANRISGRSHSEDSTDKRLQRSGSQGDLGKTDPPVSKTPPARVTTPPLPVVQTYLTMSKSHPSLFHLSPRKRGRPKLATVNSLNEEIERAHMMAQSEPKPPPPPIPVITSLKIKPIPPPPPPAQQQVEAPSPTDLPREPTHRSRSKSQGDLSEEKSDAEDSTGRRASRRRTKTIATRLEELSAAEKAQAVTQEPLLSPSGSTSASRAPPSTTQGQEKITLRVTRDEKCNLKVEKQLRPAVVSETLHDSGFCEDVVADPTPPVQDQKEKAESAGPLQKAGHHKAGQSQDTASSANRELGEVGSPRHIHHGTKKDLRKSKRKSVEDWVNEQSKWVHTHEEEAAKQRHSLMSPPEGKARKVGENSQKLASPAATKEPPPPAKSTQRRGRKRTNPVKITKPEAPADAQPDKSAGAPPPRAQSSSESAEVTFGPPRLVIDKEQGVEAVPKPQGNCHSPRGKSRQEAEHPKKSPELVIPRYIPNAASSVPLTVTHARNKRLRETDHRSALSGQDTSAAAGNDSPEKDSEKSKFFKEALNLSMKETDVVPPQCKETSAVKLPEGLQNSALEEPVCMSTASVNQSNLVTKGEGPPPKNGAASQPRTAQQLAERAAFRNSTKVPGKRDAAMKDALPEDIEEEKNSRTEGSVQKGGRSLRSPPNLCKNKSAPVTSRVGATSANKNSPISGASPSTGSKSTIPSANTPAVAEVKKFGQAPSSTPACNAKAPAKVASSAADTRSSEQVQSSTRSSPLRAAGGAKTPLNVVTAAGTVSAEQSLKSPQAQVSSSISPTGTVGPEILPRINETGVFRLEFPVSEPPRKSPTPEVKDSDREAASSVRNAVEQRQQVSRTPPCVGREMSESLRNIALVQESMMDSRNTSRGLSSCLRKEPAGDAKAAQRSSPRGSPASSTMGILGENSVALKTEPLASKNAVKNASHSPATLSRPQSSPKPPFVNDVKVPVHELGSLFSTHTNKGVGVGPVARDCLRVPDVGTANTPMSQRLLALANLPMLKVPNDTSSCRKEKTELMRIENERVRGSPSPVRSPVPSFDGRGTIANTSPYSVASLVRTADVRVGGNQKGFWRPVNIGTPPEQLPVEAALQKIAANKHISIGRPKDTRPQAAARNEHKVSPQVVPQSLSVSIVTCSSSAKVRAQANHVSRIPHPSAPANVPPQLNVGGERESLHGKSMMQHNPGLRIDSGFLGHTTVSPHRLQDAFRMPTIDRKGGVYIPASLTVCPTSPQKGSPSPPMAHSPARSSSVVLGERLSPSTRVDRSDQPCVSPRPSSKGLLSPTGVASTRPEVHSSSSEELGVPRISEAGAMASPKASENMYRTTVAEIDLFTTLSIIDTMKGKATVHDIIDDYITNLGSFFCTLETASGETRQSVEGALASKHDKLLRVIELLKKLTSDLTSGQLTRVLALEALVDRFLLRCRTPAEPSAITEVPIALPEWGVSTTSAVLQQVRLANVKEEPLDSEMYVHCDALAVLGEHFSYAMLRKRTLKRLKCGLKLRDLLGPRRQLASVTLPPRVSICRRFLPQRPGGCFPAGPPLFRRGRMSGLPPRPAAPVCLPARRLLFGCLPCGSFSLPLSTVIVDALSSLLTGLLPNLVNPGAPTPRNGQHLIEPTTTTTTTAISTLALMPVAGGALTYLEEPCSRSLERTVFSALSRYLSGQWNSRGQLPNPPVHFWNQLAELDPNRHQSKELACLSRCTLFVEATSESSLVISSPQSNSKLVIGPEVNRQLLSTLLDRLQFIPKSQGRGVDMRSLLNSATLASGSQRGRCRRMLTSCAEAPDQRLPAVALGGSGSNACVAEPSAKPLPKPLTKPLPKPLAKPEGTVTRKFLRKRALAAVSEAPILEKRRRLTSNTVEQPSAQSRPAGVSGPEKPQAVSKDCVVVLRRLELLDMKEIMLKRRRSLRFRGGSAQPKKKPKLSVFPKALSGVQR